MSGHFSTGGLRTVVFFYFYQWNETECECECECLFTAKRGVQVDGWWIARTVVNDKDASFGRGGWDIGGLRTELHG